MVFNKATFWIQMHDLPLSCINEDVGIQIGSTIGTVVECDVDEDGNGWGDVLRVFIEIDLLKAILRSRSINLKGKKLWVHFTYEKLSKLCFKCGRSCSMEIKGVVTRHGLNSVEMGYNFVLG